MSLDFLHTVRHLRPSQVLWRLRYAAERRARAALGSPQTHLWHRSKPPVVREDLPIVPKLRSPGLGVEDLAQGNVELLNTRFELGLAKPDWRLGERATDRLWTVTLHYHEWLEALAESNQRRARPELGIKLIRHYLSDWIRRCAINQPGSLALAWNAYAIATRLGWWARMYQHSDYQLFGTRPVFEAQFLRSFWQQASYLNAHLEWDLRGNHLMRDALGLAWAGRFFEGSQPSLWLKRATDLAVGQAAEQILADGGHFERSPGYHVEIMEDLLTLALLVETREARAELTQAWAAMAEYLAWLRHPDGDIPLFNDAALRGAEKVVAALDQGRWIGVSIDPSPRQGGRVFADTGMVVWHGPRWTLFFDVGPVGPDYQPGHAHADNLSLECSFQGQRLFVDPGSICYDEDDRRRYDRSTAAHNTVCIDDTDSSDMWKIFRVGRRARPHDVSCDLHTHGLQAEGSHDGYDRLPGRPYHRRRVSVQEDGPLRIEDYVAGSGDHRVQGGLLVAPTWQVENTNDGWRLASGELRVNVSLSSPQPVTRYRESRPYHPAYGVEQSATRIGWRWQGALPVEVHTVVEPS
ncbi:MAG: alginate lyase family protein [Acidobacteriota bacterium]